MRSAAVTLFLIQQWTIVNNSTPNIPSVQIAHVTNVSHEQAALTLQYKKNARKRLFVVKEFPRLSGIHTSRLSVL